jgi:hypothetical protein
MWKLQKKTEADNAYIKMNDLKGKKTKHSYFFPVITLFNFLEFFCVFALDGRFTGQQHLLVISIVLCLF